jgi:DNA-binding response OmpR family regulator
MKTKILYIEDEIYLGKVVHETLQNQGFDVLLLNDGAKVMQSLKSFIPDICVIDIMLPNIDGYTLCRQIKSLYSQMPVIFLTAKIETSDLIKGFECGGTDYMRKPFSIEELVLRIKNQLMLLKGEIRKNQEVVKDRKLGKYTFYPDRYELQSPSRCIKLSQREHEVLKVITRNINQTIERKEILKAVWGDDSYFNSRTLDVYVRKLREYLSEDPDIEVVTLKCKGYIFLVK